MLSKDCRTMADSDLDLVTRFHRMLLHDDDLSQEFDKNTVVESHMNNYRALKTSLQGHPYVLNTSFAEPSLPSVPLQGLRPIALAELQLGVIHTGRVLYGTLCVPAMKFVAIQTCVEDDSGLVAKLSIYNAASSTATFADVQRLFPKGLKVAIKEPYLKRAADGKITLRVDNPANVDKIQMPGKQAVPRPLKFVDDIHQHRMDGNKRFQEQDWQGAVDCYTSCIELAGLKHAGDGTDCLLLAYSNRAEAWMKLENYEDALTDSIKALQLDPNHLKSLFRKGRALHSLHRYSQACACFEEALKKDGKRREIHTALQESRRCCSQSERGEFKGPLSKFVLNLHKFKSNAGKACEAPSCCDYIGPVVIKMTPDGRGRGLFVCRDVKPGDLLLVSNAMAICYQDNKNVNFHLGLDMRMETTSQQDLVTEVVKLAMSSPKYLHQLYSLARSNASDQESLQIPPTEMFQPDGGNWMPDSPIQVEMDRIREIVSLNSFGDERSRYIQKTERGFDYFTKQGFSGMWLLPSFINHSCIPNATRLHVGKAMFIHASRDIHEGQEITISYFDTLVPLQQREDMCMNWGFYCKCARCIVERSLRSELFESLNSRFGELHDRAVEEATTALRAGTLLLPANFPKCAEFARLTIQLEKKMNTMRNNKLTCEETQWLRASFSLAYRAGMMSEEFVAESLQMPMFPSPQELMDAITATVPGDLQTLALSRLVHAEQARDACIRTFGKLEPAVIKQVISFFYGAPPFP